MSDERVREGRVVVRRAIEALKPGDLVQHYSTWDQTYGDPIRREVVNLEYGPDVREHDLVVTWRDPDGESVDYQTRAKPDAKVDVVVRPARTRDSKVEMPFKGDYDDAVEWCERTADDYGSEHAAMVDLLFAPGEDYEDVWLRRLWEVGEFVRKQDCRCSPQMVEDHEMCERCRLLNVEDSGR